MSKKHISEGFEPTYIPCLKIDTKNNRRFLFDFRVDGKRYRKLYYVKAANHNKRDNIDEASAALTKYRKEIKNGISVQCAALDEYFYKFMSTKTRSVWNEKLIRYYNLYIGNCNLYGIEATSDTKLIRKYGPCKIGHKKINDIHLLHFEKIKKNMEDIRLAERTQNILFEILHPLYEWLIINKHIEEDNIAKHIKQTINVKKQKRIVVNPQSLLKELYRAIYTLYADNPYYRAMFLFFFYGRRKTETLELKWNHIDLENNSYTIVDPKIDEQQTFMLPAEVKEALLQIPDTKRGYVFKSPVKKGKHIVNIERHAKKIKDMTTDKFSIHYCRHILVSALAEQNVSKIVLQNVLGHTDGQSINRYISNDNKNAGKFTQPIINKMLKVA